MTPVQDALQRFRRDKLSFDQLQFRFDTLVKEGSQSVTEMLGELDAAFKRAEIPPQVYFSLRTGLLESWKGGGNGQQDETTRMDTAHPGKVRGSTAERGTAFALDSSAGGHVRSPASPANSPDAPTTLGALTEARTTVMPAQTDHSGPGTNRQPRETLGVGDTLKDRFVLQEVLGRGGMGVVFKALDLRRREASDKDPYVALKVLNQDFRENPMSFVALQRESKRAQTLSHPNIIHVYDFDRDGPHVFMSMEYLRGRPLNHLIRDLSEGGLKFHQAWPLILGMSAALAHAHKKDIVHSDFKPGNVFVDDQQEVRVLDFGIACAIGRHDKGDATIFNARDLGALTPAYASLEMLQGKEPDARDDIYALACVSYELLSGKHPFGRLAADKVLELSLQPKPIPGLSRRRWRALQKALALRREDRTATVAEFIRELQPRSPAYYGAWMVGFTIIAAVAINVYFNLQAPEVLPKPTITLSADQQAKIKDLLELADIHFEVGYLTAPTGSNALWAYREVLKIDPYNDKAPAGLRRIADALEQKAWDSYERGNRADALKTISEGLDADPQHQGLLKLRSKLQN